MRPASPRKSSTSSARIPFERPRYLGVEVEGEPFPPPSLPAWDHRLRAALDAAGAGTVRFSVVRADGPRSVIAVSHLQVTDARRAWNAPSPADRGRRLATRGTWGTLLLAKRWCAQHSIGKSHRARVPPR